MKNKLPENNSTRLASLDILRGFDLFLLVFFQPVFAALVRQMNLPFLNGILYQFDHEVWEGFRFWDLVMPPIYYIEQLMSFLKKPYYICLLNAAELLGAAHQRPQKFSVMTILPKSSVSENKNSFLSWIYRKQIPDRLLQEKNSETGTILFSNPELTAIDLVQYEQYVGGLSRVSTVLAELVEKTDFSNAVEDYLFDNTSVATIQRLGYILDCILNESEQADTLYEQLRIYDKRLNYIPLSSRHPRILKGANRRWKININIDIEIDEL